MPLTQIDPAVALLVIDLQKGIVTATTAHPANEIVSRAAKLARAFRERGLPVVLVHVTGGAPGRTDAGPPKVARAADWAELVPELERQASDHIVTKQRWGAFTETDLNDYLRRCGVTQIVLCGISTSIGVETTARNAYELGYNVVLAVDAMTDTNADAHRNSVEAIFPRLGQSDTTDNILKMLKTRR